MLNLQIPKYVKDHEMFEPTQNIMTLAEIPNDEDVLRRTVRFIPGKPSQLHDENKVRELFCQQTQKLEFFLRQLFGRLDIR